MFDNDGVLSGWVRYLTDGTKKILKGSKSGIVGADAIRNLRTRKPVKVVFKTAGISDYLCLAGKISRLGLEADYYTFTNGAGEMEKPDKFEPLLRPALERNTVVVIQDNDEAGEAGALRWAEAIAGYAQAVYIKKLPEVIFDYPIKDLRDFFAMDDSLNENDTTFFQDLLYGMEVNNEN